MNNFVQVNLDLTEASSQIFSVSLLFKPKTHKINFSLPAWTPGSYTIREHSQYLFSLVAYQNDEILNVCYESPSKWSLELDKGDDVKIQYNIEARRLTVRTCYLDPTFASLCLPASVLLVEGHRFSNYKLFLSLPPGWQSHVPLPGENEYIAKSYDLLVDAPVHAGNFESHSFKVRNYIHKIIIIGESPVPLPKSFVSDIQNICQTTCLLMDTSPPAKNQYLFVLLLFQLGYGGLEHDNSSVLQYNWKKLQRADGYRKLLQLIAHEYLHQWNVRRLRPIELNTYDYSKSMITDSLWFAEGVTSYFDLCIPVKAGLTTVELLLEDLSNELTSYFNTPGRKLQSLADSSREAWVKLYKSTAASRDTQISYYLQGTLISLCLDILLRKSGSSLSQLLRILWNKFGVNLNGYKRNDIIFEISTIDPQLANDLEKWLDVPDSLPIESSLKLIGISIYSINEEFPDCGITLSSKEGLNVVERVAFGSQASKAGVVLGDEIVALNGFRVNRVSDFLSLQKPKTPQTITLFRRGQIMEMKMQSLISYKKSFKLCLDQDPTQIQVHLRENWLKIN